MNGRWKEGAPAMSIKGKSYIVGIYEHPTRLAQDKTVPQLHAECALGALQDAGRAKVVGVKTFGTGTVLGEFPLSDGSALRVGTAALCGSRYSGSRGRSGDRRAQSIRPAPPPSGKIWP